jgi:hypothetical protein
MPIATHSQMNFLASSTTLGTIRAMKEDSDEKVTANEETELSARKWIRCDTPHCGNPAVGLLALRFYCVGHFISHCYEYLERCNCNPLKDADVVTSFSVDRFLQQCMNQAGELVRPIRGFDNLDRARLFDIFLWASDLVAKRSVFKAESIASSQSGSYSADRSKKVSAD